MASSADGRIVVQGWPDSVAAAVRREYEVVHATYAADGWICGRVTMEPFAQATRSDREVAMEHDGEGTREDFRAPGNFTSYAFAVDARGRLAWARNDIDGDHVVAILSARVSDDYLAFLRARGVSYLLAGTGDVDLSLALAKVGATFGVRSLMLEGGGSLNGSMLRAGLVDELSLLIAPVADGRVGIPTVADVGDAAFAPSALTLEQVERREGGVVWLRYRVRGPGESH
jgi:2,5-diamino-6-(ribosylamino)-4(3H)-pyrimidinone 5'-phosphate reductase